MADSTCWACRRPITCDADSARLRRIFAILDGYVSGMTLTFATDPAPEEIYKKRARKARKWARLTMVLLIGTWLAAIWQEEALGPPIHAGMKQASVKIQAFIEESDSAKQYISMLNNFVGGGNQSDESPVAQVVNKLRQ